MSIMETMERERRPRRSFSKEFKKDAVDLDLTESAPREWVRQADIDDGRRDGLTTTEREEPARLRKETGCCARSATSSSVRRLSSRLCETR
jgi:transposase